VGVSILKQTSMTTKIDLKTTNKAIKLLATGKPQDDIADSLNISQPSVSRIKQNNRDAIAKETERLISCLPDIIGQTIRDIELSNKLSLRLSGEDMVLSEAFDNPQFVKAFMELAYKKQSDVLRTLGIYPSASPSVFIETLIQSRNTVINPLVLEALGKHLRESLEEN